MKRSMKAAFALVVLFLSCSITLAYTKPVTYNKDSDTLIFRDFYNDSPHGWIIVKAIDLLRRDGYLQEADVAQKYLLPMLEGVTFNDVWGDADLAGASVLDYYVPNSPDTNYGFGSALFAYKNPTSAFKTHPFYGYENAAEHAQFRYDYAVRISTGQWGTDPRDLMAGWVVDRVFGQEDPMNGRWASGAAAINGQDRFGAGQTPASALLDLLQNHSRSQVVFPDQTEDALSKIYVPTKEVFDQAPEWLDEHFNDADDIEAYSGYDGQGNAVYANWTLDAGGAGPNCSGCFLSFITGGDTCNAAPMIVRVPVHSRAHAFFQLGWALHLLEDTTTPVHTINGSLSTFEVHNDVESMADQVLVHDVQYLGQTVKEALPALSLSSFTGLYPYPPSVAFKNLNCINDAVNPAQIFKPRWYADTLALQANEGVAHAYARDTAEITRRFVDYIECIDTEEGLNWSSMGFFTAYGLDLGIKSAAGLIHQFMTDSGLGDHEPPTLTLVALSPSPTNQSALAFTGSATDVGSKVKSVEYSLDDGQTWQAANPSDGAFDGVTEAYAFTTPSLPDGTYAVRARATDVSNNVTAAAAQPRIVIVVDTTPPVISILAPVPTAYPHSASLVLSYSASDGAGSGVKSVAATLDGSATLGGHGLATGQTISLLTELALGSHTFVVTAVDNADNVATKTVSFTIIVTPDSIKDDVRSFVASGAIKQNGETSLLQKLDAAAAQRAAGNCTAASNIYQAFINEINAQTGKKITPAAAAIMIADAQYLIAHCP